MASEQWDQMAAILDKFFADVSQQLDVLWRAMQPLVDAVYEHTYNQYRLAGMPYGDNHDGLIQWLDDLAEIRKHEAAAQRIRDAHEMRALGRQLGIRLIEFEGAQSGKGHA